MNKNNSVVPEADHAWFLAVPKRQEFTMPAFHLGERVKWRVAGEGRSPRYQSGRVMGLVFRASQEWHYIICVDVPETDAEAWQEHPATVLTLVPDTASIRSQIDLHQSPWQMSEAAAAALGISAAQLRKLRRQGMFKAGHHYRDTSVPGSGKPRWQWHVGRCEKALAIAPEKRDIYPVP